MARAVRLRPLPLTLLAGAIVFGAVAPATSAAPAAGRPCVPRRSVIDGRHAIAFCGPATVTIDVAGRTYRFSDGICDRSATMGALELELGTLVAGAPGNAGRSFVSLVIAQSPSESEAFEADAGGRRLFPDWVIAQGDNLPSKGTFESVLGGAFSGSWDCHGVIRSGP